VDELCDEVKDRYGRLPEPVDNLFKIARIRVLAAELGIKRVSMAAGGFRVEHSGDKIRAMAVWTWLEEKHPGVKEATFSGGNAIVVSVNQWDKGSQLNKAFKLLQSWNDSIEAALGKSRGSGGDGRRADGASSPRGSGPTILSPSRARRGDR
jgi:transcription-repair coupling factor (superfamily II helicase)